MSWQDYVNTQLVGKNLKEAAIAGHDGNLWAKSANFNVTSGEIQTILQNYDTQHNLASTGFSLGGQRYFYLSGDEEVMRGKQGKGGVHLVKTNQALLVGVYEAPMEPSAAATATEKLGDYLKGVGY
uniref:Profilin n=1 Tax=Calanus sinicus TaxID=114070 RepID=A0A0U2V7H9_CALSV|nr:profilin [Calanus sinicus]